MMKQFFLMLFTWWNGQTPGTWLFTRRKGTFVGEDDYGNRYYKNDNVPPLGERRWVIYNGVAEATMIPVGWHGWMHHKTDVPPCDEDYQPKSWQRPHRPNMTGTAQAYRPEGSILAGGARAPATGDYEAWSP